MQEEKAARIEAERKLAAALQAQGQRGHQCSGMSQSLHETNGAVQLEHASAVQADLMLAREGLEQLCHAVQGRSHTELSIVLHMLGLCSLVADKNACFFNHCRAAGAKAMRSTGDCKD